MLNIKQQNMNTISPLTHKDIFNRSFFNEIALLAIIRWTSKIDSEKPIVNFEDFRIQMRKDIKVIRLMTLPVVSNDQRIFCSSSTVTTFQIFSNTLWSMVNKIFCTYDRLSCLEMDFPVNSFNRFSANESVCSNVSIAPTERRYARSFELSTKTLCFAIRSVTP